MIEETHHHRMILCGDFNLNQLLQENVIAFLRLPQEFNLHQRVTYSTHIHGGILNLVFDQERTDTVQTLWMPTPYSDHFFIIIDLDTVSKVYLFDIFIQASNAAI
jgi:hypothetical protein